MCLVGGGLMGTLVIKMEPARRRANVQGWAARIVAWPEGRRPDLAFGHWDAKRLVATLDGLERGEVILYGANGKKMVSWDKFTYFGRVGCEDDGSLRVIRMHPPDGDAREHWQHPTDPHAEVTYVMAALAALDPAGEKDAAIAALELVHRGLAAHGLRTSRSIDQNGGHVTAIPEILDRLSRLEAVFTELRELHGAARTFFQAWEQVRQERKAARSLKDEGMDKAVV